MNGDDSQPDASTPLDPMQKYGFVKKDLGPDELFDYYQAEREYFDSFYYDPEIQDARSANIR